jgi:hypothetical protein
MSGWQRLSPTRSLRGSVKNSRESPTVLIVRKMVETKL